MDQCSMGKRMCMDQCQNLSFVQKKICEFKVEREYVQCVVNDNDLTAFTCSNPNVEDRRAERFLSKVDGASCNVFVLGQNSSGAEQALLSHRITPADFTKRQDGVCIFFHQFDASGEEFFTLLVRLGSNKNQDEIIYESKFTALEEIEELAFQQNLSGTQALEQVIFEQTSLILDDLIGAKQ